MDGLAAAGAAWGLYTLFGRGRPLPLTVTARNFLLAAPVAAAFLLLPEGGGAVTGTGLLLAVVSGALTSGLGYCVWYLALRGHSATSAGLVQLAVPVLAAAAGVALLGESLTPRLGPSSISLI